MHGRLWYSFDVRVRANSPSLPGHRKASGRDVHSSVDRDKPSASDMTAGPACSSSALGTRVVRIGSTRLDAAVRTLHPIPAAHPNVDPTPPKIPKGISGRDL